ncbi:cell wall elongation regulator TseB-like domain-containing protein [Bacillus fonticola]|uniref:cell wall elongation regulator TseB-like domain-containing protein n=1 Tax=Bacillus fonticola TaxID=2728853 RepID=UPI0014739C10|nr:DUF5590 domain-containing protein [Bacillus fonticola]
MKRTLVWSSVILFGLVVIGASSLFVLARQPLEEEEALGRQLAIEQGIEKIDWVGTYHFTDSYAVVSGANQDGEPIYAWIPFDNPSKTTIALQEEGVTAEEALSIAREEWDIVEHIETKLGKEKNDLIWELTFIDGEGRYTILHVDFESGEWLRYYRYL